MTDHHKSHETEKAEDAEKWALPYPGWRQWGKPAYIRECDRYVEEQRAKDEARKKAKEQEKNRQRVAPLETRLARLLSTMTEVERREGLSIAELQPRLMGRHRGHARSGDIGMAFRKLGYSRVRSWKRDAAGGAGFRALWYPIR